MPLEPKSVLVELSVTILASFAAIEVLACPDIRAPNSERWYIPGAMDYYVWCVVVVPYLLR
jgi:hypothetical protein